MIVEKFEKLIKVRGRKKEYMLYSHNITIFFDRVNIGTIMIFLYLGSRYIGSIDISEIEDNVLKKLRGLHKED